MTKRERRSPRFADAMPDHSLHEPTRRDEQDEDSTHVAHEPERFAELNFDAAPPRRDRFRRSHAVYGSKAALDLLLLPTVLADWMLNPALLPKRPPTAGTAA